MRRIAGCRKLQRKRMCESQEARQLDQELNQTSAKDAHR